MSTKIYDGFTLLTELACICHIIIRKIELTISKDGNKPKREFKQKVFPK